MSAFWVLKLSDLRNLTVIKQAHSFGTLDKLRTGQAIEDSGYFSIGTLCLRPQTPMLGRSQTAQWRGSMLASSPCWPSLSLPAPADATWSCTHSTAQTRRNTHPWEERAGDNVAHLIYAKIWGDKVRNEWDVMGRQDSGTGKSRLLEWQQCLTGFQVLRRVLIRVTSDWKSML